MKLIVANWKLNPLTLHEARSLAAGVTRTNVADVILCPPTLFLGAIDYPKLGAQDSFWAVKGAFTGQTSPKALSDLGVRYVIIGHSEMRTLGLTDEQVNAKLKACLENNLIPILCVGWGTTMDQDEFAVIDILKDQLERDLEEVDPKKIVVAYEPVWAISTGDPATATKAATPDHAEHIALYLKNKFKISQVLYGGSVNGKNARGFLDQPNIDGLLVGGASLVINDFNEIINEATHL